MRPADERLVADVAAGEVEPSLHLEIGFGFDFLRKKLAEDDLLGEILRANDGVVGARW